MTYFKTFFHVLRNSFSSAAYYKHVLEAPFSFSLKYFLFFSFLLAIITTIFLSIKITIPLNDFLIRFPKILVQIYPQELEIKINKGIVTTNLPQPYFIPIDRFEKSFEELDKRVKGINSDKIKNILVIDTNASVEDLKRYQTYALLTKSYLSFYKEDGRIETISLEKIDNFRINQSLVRGIINRFLPVLKFLPLFIIPFLFTGSLIFLTTSQLIYLLITAFILFIITKMISFPLSFAKTYQIDLHLTTIITPFFLLLGAFNIQINFPFSRLMLFTIVGLFILNSLKKSSPSLVGAKK